MGKIWALLAVLLLFLVAITSAAASEAEWLWSFKASDSGGSNGAASGYIGTTNADSDGYQGTRDKYLDPGLLGGLAAYGVYHEEGVDEWSGPTGYYRQDMRAPLAIGETKVWSPVYVWAAPGFPGSAMRLSWTPGMSGSYLPVAGLVYQLKLTAVPESVIGAPAVGTIWNLAYATPGSILLPTIEASSNGAGDEGYAFEFSVKAATTPEPAGFAALLLGAAGIAGSLIRRRK